MSDLFQKAFDEASSLPEDQQDEFARWMLEVLADEENGAACFQNRNQKSC
jgi:hypothetical protein